MANPTFIQRPMLDGRVIFHVSGEKLEVTSYGLGGKAELVIPLIDLSPNYTRVSRHRWVLAMGLLGLSALLFGIIWASLTSDEPHNHLARELGILLAVTLSYGVRSLMPFVHYEFRSRDGKNTLRVFREIYQAKECDAFIAQLAACIQAVHGGLTPAEIAQQLDSIEARPADPFQKQWVLALVFGALAAVLPALPGFTHKLDAFGLLLVIGLTIGAMTCCVYSFLHKERLRWLSLIGAALGLVPPLFY